jgi:hypothetical protein
MIMLVVDVMPIVGSPVKVMLMDAQLDVEFPLVIIINLIKRKLIAI